MGACHRPDLHVVVHLVLCDGTWTYTHDDTGGVVGKSKSGEAWAYTYDVNGQMTSASKSATVGGAVTDAVAYTYDAWGNRVSRTQTGTTSSTERYVVDGWDTAKGSAVGTENFDVTLDLNGSNGVTGRRLFGAGSDPAVARRDAGGAVSWYGADGLGSVRQVFDNSGAVTGSRAFDGFGNVTSSSGTGLDRYGYTGTVTDPLTGLVGDNARSYDPTTGRWLSQDPKGFGAGDVNLYRYVGNNATGGRDPSGMDKWDGDLLLQTGLTGLDGRTSTKVYHTSNWSGRRQLGWLADGDRVAMTAIGGDGKTYTAYIPYSMVKAKADGMDAFSDSSHEMWRNWAHETYQEIQSQRRAQLSAEARQREDAVRLQILEQMQVVARRLEQQAQQAQENAYRFPDPPSMGPDRNSVSVGGTTYYTDKSGGIKYHDWDSGKERNAAEWQLNAIRCAQLAHDFLHDGPSFRNSWLGRDGIGWNLLPGNPLPAARNQTVVLSRTRAQGSRRFGGGDPFQVPAERDSVVALLQPPRLYLDSPGGGTRASLFALQQRIANYKSTVSARDLIDADTEGGRFTPGHAWGNPAINHPGHGVAKPVVADILSKPEALFSGVYKQSGRLVDIYFKNGTVVITQYGQKAQVITAYGKADSHGKAESIEKYRDFGRVGYYVEIKVDDPRVGLISIFPGQTNPDTSQMCFIHEQPR